MLDIRPDMRQRALFVTSRAEWRWNKMLLARENVDSPLAAMVLATEHNALCASRCQPPSVDNGTGSRLKPVPAACSLHFVPATRGIPRDEQCSLPHIRSSVWHLRRNFLFQLST